MAALVWDATGSRYYELGVDHGVLYPMLGTGKYSTGVAWNGLINVTESPDGAEPNDLYADNIKYATLRSAETFGATIEAYTYPEEFYACDGTATPSKGVYVGQQSRAGFGFAYRTKIGNDTNTEDDDGYKLHLIYNATASPSERQYSTINENPDAITFSWEVTTTPVNVTGYKPTACITIDSLKADATKLAALEAKLYGDDTNEPTLPTPDEVLEMFKETA